MYVSKPSIFPEFEMDCVATILHIPRLLLYFLQKGGLFHAEKFQVREWFSGSTR